MQAIHCLFRTDVRNDSEGESAQCRLLEQIIERKSPVSFRISRSACEACRDHASGNLLADHPVMPSLLLQICEASLLENETAAAPREENSRLQKLFNSALLTLAQQDNRRGAEPMPSCDVILCAEEIHYQHSRTAGRRSVYTFDRYGQRIHCVFQIRWSLECKTPPVPR